MDSPNIRKQMETPAVKRMKETRRGLFIESASQPKISVEAKPRKANALSIRVASCWLMPFQTMSGMKWVEIA